jgi:histidinol dehydrogenase
MLERSDWSELDALARKRVLDRPLMADAAQLGPAVSAIIERVKADGDTALKALTKELDKVELDSLAVPERDFEQAEKRVDAALLAAMDDAAERIAAFHSAQQPQTVRVETAPGVICYREARPIGRVGLYVPAGSAPLPSTALMLAVPARLAGCREVVLCSPPGPDGKVNEVVLVAAKKMGVSKVFALGGAQAIAAMAYGSESVPRCDKLFGPGNRWVTEAKQQVARDPNGAALDMPAGPSEVMVLADDAANPEFVAADLLSQAEHGPDSQVMLVATANAVVDAVEKALADQLARLPRADIARQALGHSRAIVVKDASTAVEVANAYAAEHLIIQLREAERWASKIMAAGSVFIGAWTPESLGDYCSGTNHVLPTYGHARAYSGLGLESFMTQITFQQATPAGLRRLANTAETLAHAEGLQAHAEAVRLRREASS